MTTHFCLPSEFGIVISYDADALEARALTDNAIRAFNAWQFRPKRGTELRLGQLVEVIMQESGDKPLVVRAL